MTLTNALGKAGTGAQIIWNGKRWHISVPDLRHEQAFEEWLKAGGRAELAAAKNDIAAMDPDDYAAAMAYFAQTARVRYSYYGPLATRARQTPEGILEMLRLLIQENHPKITEEQIRQMVLDESKQIDMVLRSFFSKKSPVPIPEEEVPPEPEDIVEEVILGGSAPTTKPDV